MAKKTAVEQRLDDLGEKIDDGFSRMEKALEKHAADDKETFDDHCDRLGALERSYAGLIGKLAVVGTLATIATTAAAKYLLP